MNTPPPTALDWHSQKWDAAVSDVASVPEDSEAVRLIAGAKNFRRLAHLPRLRRLLAFTLDQGKLEVLGDCRLLENVYLDGVRAADLSPLHRLRSLRFLQIDSCGLVSSLDWIAGLPELTGLAVVNFRKVRDLEPLRARSGLRELAVGGGMWSRMTVETLDPLSALTTLQYLDLTSLRTSDNSLRPLRVLTQLRRLAIAGSYPASEFATLSRFLTHTDCMWFEPVNELQGQKCRQCSAQLVMLTGKGTLVSCVHCHAERIRKHIELFRQSVRES